MRAIEPKKGISQRLIINGLSEKHYIVMFAIYIVTIFVAAHIIKLLTESKISFNAFFILFIIIAGFVVGLRIFLSKKTEKENSKSYPKGNITIINKNFL